MNAKAIEAAKQRVGNLYLDGDRKVPEGLLDARGALGLAHIVANDIAEVFVPQALEAARPHIEADLRGKIAAEIRASKAPITQITNIMYNAGIEDAARIAEGTR